MPTFWETFHNVRAKAQSQDVRKSTQCSRLHIKRSGKQKFKKWHVISSTFHVEKRVDCTCIYVLNASNKGSGETAQKRRLVGALGARIGTKNHCQLRVYVF